jgi:hypothetical protein
MAQTGESLTCRELEARTNRLAHLLRARGSVVSTIMRLSHSTTRRRVFRRGGRGEGAQRTRSLSYQEVEPGSCARHWSFWMAVPTAENPTVTGAGHGGPATPFSVAVTRLSSTHPGKEQPCRYSQFWQLQKLHGGAARYGNPVRISPVAVLKQCPGESTSVRGTLPTKNLSYGFAIFPYGAQAERAAPAKNPIPGFPGTGSIKPCCPLTAVSRKGLRDRLRP